MLTIERPDGDGALTGFLHFWLKYVRGFEPATHCARCLCGKYERRVKPTMALGSVVLDRDPDAPVLYLCGVTRKWATNLHLAFRPKPGVRIELEAHGGHRVVVEDAEALPIPALPSDFRGLPAKYTTCRNYQFGVAHFGVPS